MVDEQPVQINGLSCCSLRVEAFSRGHSVGKATGFVVEHRHRPFLITNWHVLAGRNADTDELLSDTGATPDAIEIVHHAVGELGHWVRTTESLTEGGCVRWLEHPEGRRVDIAALPLSAVAGVAIHPLDMALGNPEIVPEVAMPVCIIGFPFGLAAGPGFPIWKIGHIASEPELNYDDRSAFLIDATTRGGMSGSPVVLLTHGPYRSGSLTILSGTGIKFLGVYSGRIHDQADIGRVWRPDLIQDLLNMA